MIKNNVLAETNEAFVVFIQGINNTYNNYLIYMNNIYSIFLWFFALIYGYTFIINFWLFFRSLRDRINVKARASG